CPRMNPHPCMGLGCQPRCLHWRCLVGLDIISAWPGETFPMPYPPPKGSWSAMAVPLRGFNHPQGTAIAPQLEQMVTQASHAPCAPPLVQPSKQKTTAPTRLLALTQDRLYDALATAGQRLTCRTPDFRRHTFCGRGRGLQGCGCRSRVPLAGRG